MKESIRQATIALDLMNEIDEAIETNKNHTYVKRHVIPTLKGIASNGKVAPKVVLDIRLAMDKYELFCECQDEYIRKLNALENEYRERVEEALSDVNCTND